MAVVDLTWDFKGERYAPEIVRKEVFLKSGKTEYTGVVYNISTSTMMGSYIDFPGHIKETDDGVNGANSDLADFTNMSAAVIRFDRAGEPGGITAEDLENAYSYRILWHAHNAPWVHAMAWGNYHPLRRAMTLIAAHKISGDEKYLQGAYLANDFHNGANPLGRSMTSGLGKIYPAVFLDLVSYADKYGEFVPGITPYGNTFGLDRNAVKMVYGKNADKLPIFRRYVNLEFLSVPSSEYSVWETIAPAAVTTGYLIENPLLPSDDLKNIKPADDFRKLPGYRALP